MYTEDLVFWLFIYALIRRDWLAFSGLVLCVVVVVAWIYATEPAIAAWAVL